MADGQKGKPRKHENTKKTLKDYSLQPIGQNNGIEVHQQGDTQFGNSQVAQYLRMVNWREPLDRFDFEKDSLLDDDVQTMMAEYNSSVPDRHLFFDLK